MGLYRLYGFPMPYNADQLSELWYEQTTNVMYLAHLDRPVYKLTRAAHTDWVVDEVTFGPTIDAPAPAPVVTATSPNSTGYVATDYEYVITAIDDDTGQESRASGAGGISNDLTLDGNYNTITWTAVPGADRYRVFKNSNGVFGYIGGTEGLSFRDGTPVIIADLSDTPPRGDNPFADEGDYPSALAFHGQRLWLARTKNRPNAIWGSQVGLFENMDYSRPAKPDDALAFGIVGRRVNAVNQMLSSTSLIALTTDSIQVIAGQDGGAITPSSIIPKKQSGRGVSRLRAIDIDEITFFKPLQGASVRALGYQFDIDGFKSNDVTIFSPHLFEDDDIVDWAYQVEPYSCIWAVMRSGIMLCFTWEQEQEVWGWTRCFTDGAFERVAVIGEEGFDRVYVVTRRTINGVEKRFYERMALPHTGDITTAIHLDCAVYQEYEEPTATIGGLWHLEGATVTATFDGYEQTDLTVVDGTVTIQTEATRVTVGLPYTALIETLPLPLAAQGGSAHVNAQTMTRTTIRAIDTKGIEASVDGATFEPIAERYGQDYMGTLPTLGPRDYEIPLPSTWSQGATLTVRQARAFPMQVTALFPQIDVGDD